MMRRYWWWRRAATARWGWLLAAVGVLLVWQNSKLSQPYWLDITATSALSLLVLAPGFAALSAWDARRLRAAGAATQGCRSWWSMVITSLVPVLIWSAVALASAMGLLAARTSVGMGLPRVSLLTLTLLVVTAFSLLGLVLGRWLPTTFAVPLAFAAAWLWLALPPTMMPSWIRNVTGHIGGSCCSLNQDLAPAGLLAPALVMLALLVSCFVILPGRQPLVALVVTAAVLSGSVLTARSMVQDLGADPVRDRVARMRCTGDAPQVCVWPEHASRLAQIAPQVRDTVTAMGAAGVPLPRLVTEQTTTTPGVWVAGLSGRDVESWRSTVAQAPARLLPPPCVNDQGGRWPADPAHSVLIGLAVSRSAAAVALPLVFLMVAFLAGTDAAGAPFGWAWPLRAETDPTAWLVVTVTWAIGAGSCWLRRSWWVDDAIR